MSGFFTPNLSIGNSWRASLQAINQVFKTINIIVEDTFDWGDYDFTPNGGSMTLSALRIFRARYLKIFKFAWISFDFQATLGGAATNIISMPLPFTIASVAGIDPSVTYQSGHLTIIDPVAVNESGSLLTLGGQSVVALTRFNAANFSTGAASRFIANAFFEVQ